MVPAASTTVALLTDPFCAAHPLVRVRLEMNLRSAEIVERVRRFELDAGIVYPDQQDTDELVVVPLYQERPVLIAGAELLTGRSGTITWSEAIELPLCLLTPGMRGRRLVDDALAGQRLSVTPQLETDSLVTLLAHVRAGRWASIVPQPWIETLGPPAGVAALTLDQPRVKALIALVTTKAEPGSPVVRALVRAARDTGIHEALDRG